MPYACVRFSFDRLSFQRAVFLTLQHNTAIVVSVMSSRISPSADAVGFAGVMPSAAAPVTHAPTVIHVQPRTVSALDTTTFDDSPVEPQPKPPVDSEHPPAEENTTGYSKWFWYFCLFMTLYNIAKLPQLLMRVSQGRPYCLSQLLGGNVEAVTPYV